MLAVSPAMKVYISAAYRDPQSHDSALAIVPRPKGHRSIGMEEYVEPEVQWPLRQFDSMSGDDECGKSIPRLGQEVVRDYLMSYFRTSEEQASASERSGISRRNEPEMNFMPKRFVPVLETPRFTRAFDKKAFTEGTARISRANKTHAPLSITR
jgi:hypothetical protein